VFFREICNRVLAAAGKIKRFILKEAGMVKKILLFLVIAGIFSFGMARYLEAQNAGDGQSFIQIVVQRFNDLEAKIDKLSLGAAPAKPDTKNQEVLSKLDQVLATQQAILKELEIVKVRASRK
jgi:hypothetical protein